MPTRSYNQRCALARALDVVEGRWSLLIVRELLTGSKRYGELLKSLPRIATNLLADRLRELEAALLIRRVEGVDAAVYELTEAGRALEPALLELARWGLDHAPEVHGEPVSAASAALLAKGFLSPADRAADGVYDLRLDGRPIELRVSDGRLAVREGLALLPDATVRAQTASFLSVVTGRLDPEEARRSGWLEVEGGEEAVSRLLRMLRRGSES